MRFIILPAFLFLSGFGMAALDDALKVKMVSSSRLRNALHNIAWAYIGIGSVLIWAALYRPEILSELFR